MVNSSSYAVDREAIAWQPSMYGGPTGPMLTRALGLIGFARHVGAEEQVAV